MINYNRLGYEIKRDLANFSEKISNGLKRPQSKFLLQMIYGILAGNKLHLSEIARSLNENITLKKTIDNIESKQHIPSLLYAMRIADFFHKPVTSLFCYHPGVQQTPSKGDDMNE